MRKRLTPVGNSLGLIIEKPILNLLGIDRNTELEITTDGRRLVIQPAAQAEQKAEQPAVTAPTEARREDKPISVREVGRSFLDELRDAFK
ncbi:hypothetical protein D6779_03485 [Candidatus Parcubacteria bacterium]|nr:MAG: hypothetical protein D6779_03485 [Candidatus Parcubacteria bacterium]